MKIIKLLSFAFLGMNLVTCCSQKQEPRRPISQTSGEFMKQSVERNKKLNQNEESLIAAIIKKDTANTYISSTKGYWYYYNQKNTTPQAKPVRGDVAIFDYEIKDLNNKIVYSQAELKTQNYLVDKQDFMKGIQDGIKLMQKGEKVTFLFPSHMAFGYHGDDNRIGINQPLICTITLKDVQKTPSTEQNKTTDN